jgi:hypothetical protein
MKSSIKSLAFVALTAIVVLGMANMALAGLVSYWALDENTGTTTAYDTSGWKTNDLTTYTYAGGTAPDAGYAGMIGKAWQFYDTDPTTSQLRRVGSADMPAMSDITQSAWVWVSSNSVVKDTSLGYDTGVIRVKYTNNGRDLLNLAYTTPNPNYTGTHAYPTQARISSTTTTGTMVAAAAARYPNGFYPRLEQWSLITYTYRLSDKKQFLYVDGVLANSNTSNISGTTADSAAAIYFGGAGDGNVNSICGFLDDVGIMNEYLTAAKVGALYFTPKTLGSDASAGFYGLKDMLALFNTYDNALHPEATINGKTWQYVASGLPGELNTATQVGQVGGQYYILLGSDGSGLKAIPEPSTLVLLAAGLAGLLAYAWRKRN